MKIYISGPISNDDPVIQAANTFRIAGYAMSLEKLGHDVLSPLENGLPESATWQQHMRADIKMMMDADRVHALPGWGNSQGATAEVNLARAIGIPVVEF